MLGLIYGHKGYSNILKNTNSGKNFTPRIYNYQNQPTDTSGKLQPHVFVADESFVCQKLLRL